MIEIAVEFIGDNQANLQNCNQAKHLARFENIKNAPRIQLSIQNKNRKTNCQCSI